jgi:hypothetical protein
LRIKTIVDLAQLGHYGNVRADFALVRRCALGARTALPAGPV